jgi:3-dehydroquinate dehydratase/shikimate dehydrogenase
MQLASALPVCGFSVTIPHKQKIIRYLDAVDPVAKRIGAVNTVWRKAGRWRGTNTDVKGITIPLSKKIRLSKASVLLVGNGGAARGAAFALVDAGSKLSITGRNLEKVRSLARLTGAEAVPLAKSENNHYDALVHATPVGMHPHSKDCVFDGNIPASIVFDMVYNPMETELIRRAKAAGKDVVPGIEMFIEQAIQQFEIWTEQAAPRSVMLKAALEALGETLP